jgi:hypothetical protein
LAEDSTQASAQDQTPGAAPEVVPAATAPVEPMVVIATATATATGTGAGAGGRVEQWPAPLAAPATRAVTADAPGSPPPARSASGGMVARGSVTVQVPPSDDGWS